MSKKSFKPQASASRAAANPLQSSTAGFGSAAFGSSSFGSGTSSSLSYFYEPPDLSGDLDPVIVVSLKNLQKKDSITKAKALEVLQAQLSQAVEVTNGKHLDSSVLEAWAKLYARTSVDNNPRVRRLSHGVQGTLSLAFQKRITKHLPSLVPAWLAGIHDADKQVSRAAQDAFTSVFSSEDKREGVWKAFQKPILEWCRDAALKETPQTLSDERVTSPDDAEAKYVRVVGTALLTVGTAMKTLPKEELVKQKEVYEEALGDGDLWKFASYSDAFVRKAVYRLLSESIDVFGDLLNYKRISKSVVQDCLHINQQGSANEYLRTLVKLTEQQPKVWTTSYSGTDKKSALARLSKFLKNGSQHAPPEIWSNASKLFQILPIEEIVSGSSGDDRDAENLAANGTLLFECLHEGITRRDEHRTNQAQAWEAYLVLGRRIADFPISQKSLENIFTTQMSPIVSQYIRPTTENAGWSLPSNGQAMCIEALSTWSGKCGSSIEALLRSVSADFTQDLQKSLPEQSKDFYKSQEGLISQFTRWHSLRLAVAKEKSLNNIRPILADTLKSEVAAAISLLSNRNGKPFSAAAVLDVASRPISKDLTDKEVREAILTFIREEVPRISSSPSSSYLLKMLNNFQGVPEIGEIQKECLKSIIDSPESPAKLKSLQSIVSSPWPEDSQSAEAMNHLVQDNLLLALDGEQDRWSVTQSALQNPSLPDILSVTILTSLAAGLSIANNIAKTNASLRGLEAAFGYNREASAAFLRSERGPGLLSQLLFLSQNPEDVGTQNHAAKVKNKADSLLVEKSGGKSPMAIEATIGIVREGILDVGDTCLSIDTLVSQSEAVFSDSKNQNAEMIATLLEPVHRYDAILRPYFASLPDPSLALTSSIGGAVDLISRESMPEVLQVTYDREGHSAAFRLASFLSRLIESTNVIDIAGRELQSSICEFLAIFNQLVSDNLSIAHPISLWETVAGATEPEILATVMDLQSRITSFLVESCNVETSYIEATRKNLFQGAGGSSTRAYYSARACAELMLELKVSSGSSLQTEIEQQLPNIRSSTNVMAETAILLGATESKAMMKLCNELISDLTYLNFEEESGKGLSKFILFNAVIQAYEGKLHDVPQQRLVFFVKHIIPVLNREAYSDALISEVLKTLLFTLPLLKDLFGEFWEDTIDALPPLLQSKESPIAVLHGCLRLCALLRGLVVEDSNEDLQDAWGEKMGEIAKSLARLLLIQSKVPDSTHGPRKMVNELLARQLFALPSKEVADVEDLYPIIGCRSVPLQHAAMEMLRQKLPGIQEKVTMEIALKDTEVAHLPKELLSLISTAPDPKDCIGLSAEPELPAWVSSYLLGWKAVFEHWNGASFQVQNDYVAEVKESGHLKGFLQFAFAILIQRRTPKNIVNPSKYDIETYDPSKMESPEEDLHWLLSHIYLLCLKHLPFLSKAWWRDECPRSLEKQVADWTEKYISPLVVKAELALVSAWDPNPDQTTDLEVRVALRSREVVASYPIDERRMSIRVVLPPDYPLAPAAVTTGQRVGIDEKRWAAWLNSATIAINFASASQGLGAVVDGLAAWRKNASGMVRGQSECAICYSVLSGEKQLPTKKCGTCRNQFHGSCLFRWFRSSSSSSCPLCRNAFNYG